MRESSEWECGHREAQKSTDLYPQSEPILLSSEDHKNKIIGQIPKLLIYK